MSFNGIRLLPDYGCKIEIDVVQLLKENEFLKDELYNLVAQALWTSLMMTYRFKHKKTKSKSGATS